MTRRLSGRFVGAPGPQPVETTPDSRDTTPDKSNQQENPGMQWEEQTQFGRIHVRSTGA